MDVSQIILELREELVRLDEAILAFERLLADRPGRGRRSKNLPVVGGGPQRDGTRIHMATQVGKASGRRFR